MEEIQSSYLDTLEYEQNKTNRKGKWSKEEENYANKIIEFFNKGLLAIPSGTTLRSFLSEKLQW